jgi:hypothetical protein
MRDRDRRFPELLSVRLPARTLARISASLRQDEDGVTAFAREAIASELRRREEAARLERERHEREARVEQLAIP